MVHAVPGGVTAHVACRRLERRGGVFHRHAQADSAKHLQIVAAVAKGHRLRAVQMKVRQRLFNARPLAARGGDHVHRPIPPGGDLRAGHTVHQRGILLLPAAQHELVDVLPADGLKVLRDGYLQPGDGEIIDQVRVPAVGCQTVLRGGADRPPQRRRIGQEPPDVLRRNRLAEDRLRPVIAIGAVERDQRVKRHALKAWQADGTSARRQADADAPRPQAPQRLERLFRDALDLRVNQRAVDIKEDDFYIVHVWFSSPNQAQDTTFPLKSQGRRAAACRP